MKLEFESNTTTIPYSTNNFAEPAIETVAPQTSQMLQAGIKAAQSGNRIEARSLLIQVTEAEPKNEAAWLWMASISEYPEELVIFLNNVLSINPNNARASEWMKATKSLLAKTLVQRGVDAANDSNIDFARQCFLQAIVHDAESEMAWFWLASIADSADEKIAHLQKVLTLNPQNETAAGSLQAAKNQIADSVLRKANSAAVAGEREAARELLQEVFRHAPDLEGAWILSAYLADSFSEKITCYERVLALNPENEMAVSGLESLRTMMAKTEAKKIEQAEMLAAIEKNSENTIVADVAQNVSAEDESENHPTQELEYPPDFRPAEYENDSSFDIHSTNVDDSAPVEIVRQFEDAPQTPTEEFWENQKNLSAPAAAKIDAPEIVVKSATDAACPFCYAGTEANALACSVCRTILTLSDVEMLLANTRADRELLRPAVERMESENIMRQFSADELVRLAVGQFNLKNSRLGMQHLQKAARLNPNDVVLGSKINSLRIRLSEIEQMQMSQSSMLVGKKILVVDDSATVRKLISSKLEKVGHEVVCAVDGIEALEKIKEFLPDLVLLDIMMPQIDGYQVCKLIRANEATREVPIVMISGKDGFFDKVRGRMAGTTGYITKPFGPEALMKAVETYIVQRGVPAIDEEAAEEETAAE